MLELINNLNPVQFQEEIENISWQNEMNIMDSILYFCQVNNLEPETVKEFVNSNSKLKARLKEDYISLHFLPKPKTRKLPV